MTSCGVYRIMNTVTDRAYIGSSRQIKKRLKLHRWHLDNGSHGNRFLQASWAKHGSSTFRFEVLVACTPDKLAQREQAFIDAYVEHELPLFNLKPSADSRTDFRYRATDAVKAKQSALFKGKQFTPMTPAIRAKISTALKGRTFTLQHRTNIASARAASGYYHSAATRLKISQAAKGNRRRVGCRHSPESKALMSLRARNRSPETRAKLSVASKGRQTFLGKRHTVETKVKISLAAKGHQRWLGRRHTEESKARMSAAAKLREQNRRLKMKGLGLRFPVATDFKDEI